MCKSNVINPSHDFRKAPEHFPAFPMLYSRLGKRANPRNQAAHPHPQGSGENAVTIES